MLTSIALQFSRAALRSSVTSVICRRGRSMCANSPPLNQGMSSGPGRMLNR